MPIQRAARGEIIQAEEVDHEFADGTVAHMLISARPLYAAAKQPRGAVACMLDITYLKEAEHTLREADRRKDEFLAMLAHELRNPLAPVRNALEMMKRAGGDGLLLERARSMMERQVAHLARLIDDLMDISRITQGKLVLRRKKVSLSAVVREAADICRSTYADRALDLRLVVPPEPAYVEGDPLRLDQVIGNLLNNACKYTQQGGLVELRMTHEGDEVAVSVRDNGIGIAAEMLPRVFEMFTQGRGSLERAGGGLGVGLSLVKGLMELHGGTVTAYSAGEGQGSEFVARFPALPASADYEQPPAAVGAGVSPGSTGRARRFLVVDDNQDSAESLALLLKLQGHDTQTAVDGEEALKQARSFVPDVVLLDLGLPKLDGYEACRAIRKDRLTDQPVIIALTGWGQEEDRQKSKASGFDAHLIKPVEYDALLSMVETLLVARKADSPGSAYVWNQDDSGVGIRPKDGI